MLTLNDIQDGPPPAHAPVLIADRLWWVGHYLEGDPFQCHAYLLENGDQSVLFDPGSSLTFRHTLNKIAQVTPFSSIRWFVCHHQDPDITGALPMIDQLVTRPDARLVSHWRAKALLRHLGLDMPFWLIEEHDWQLDLGERLLRFVFTPYAHFPGAFTTFDERGGTLLSSDLFGGFTDGGSLVAQGMDYFESIRAFHEHYMPSREVLNFAIDQVSPLPIKQIAPQHGCVIPKALIAPIFRELRQLECGLYLLSTNDSDIQRLLQLSRMLRKFTNTLLDARDFRTVAQALTGIVAELLPVDAITFYVLMGESRVLFLGPEQRYRGKDLPAAPSQILTSLDAEATGAEQGASTAADDRSLAAITATTLDFGSHRGQPGLIVPLFLTDKDDKADAVAVFWLREPMEVDQQLHSLLERVGPALEVAVEREAMRRSLEMERDRIYERSIHDPLTGLYTRRHMKDTVARWAGFQDRDPERVVSVVMFDLDHFKLVNDTYGHAGGDEVLVLMAGFMSSECREGDLAVRMGGEEFAIFLFGDNRSAAAVLASRVLRQMREATFEGPLEPLRVTVSAGATCRDPGEPMADVINRADEALYAAKHGGRDRVETRGVGSVT